jgi:hypothetical protein
MCKLTGTSTLALKPVRVLYWTHVTLSHVFEHSDISQYLIAGSAPIFLASGKLARSRTHGTVPEFGATRVTAKLLFSYSIKYP